MADTHTTHLNLIKQDGNAIPDYTKDHTNLNTLDAEVWARGKAFNGTTVGDDGEFHVRTIPYAENLETSTSQGSDDTYIIRTSGGEASIEDGDAWLTLIKGSRVHTGYTAQSITMTPSWMAREEDVDYPTATINEETFVSYVSQSGTITLTYSTDWSADPANYGITIIGTPVAGDVITVVYVKEVRGTITQSNPQTFVSTGWNLYNHVNGYARVLKYSEEYGFKISGAYTALEFAATVSGTRSTITPVSGYFTVPSDGYVFVTGGNTTDTALWMTWSDWGSQANGGTFAVYSEDEIDFSTFMETNFPYGLLQVGTARDEINFNIGIATSHVVRQTYNSTNLANAKASGLQYEYDENYIYIERSTPVTYTINVDGGYTANDHGMELFTGTLQGVYAQTLYGANLKNKLERDVLTISQQTLDSTQKAQVRSNIGLTSAATSSVANNLTTTAAGSVLDARQGKALNDAKASLSGATFTGGINVSKPSGEIGIWTKNTTSGLIAELMIGSAGANHGLYSNGYVDANAVFHNDGRYIIYRNDNGNNIVNFPSYSISSNSSRTFTIGNGFRGEFHLSGAAQSCLDIMLVSTTSTGDVRYAKVAGSTSTTITTGTGTITLAQSNAGTLNVYVVVFSGSVS